MLSRLRPRSVILLGHVGTNGILAVGRVRHGAADGYVLPTRSTNRNRSVITHAFLHQRRRRRGGSSHRGRTRCGLAFRPQAGPQRHVRRTASASAGGRRPVSPSSHRQLRRRCHSFPVQGCPCLRGEPGHHGCSRAATGHPSSPAPGPPSIRSRAVAPLIMQARQPDRGGTRSSPTA